jgi:hypothetical protein
LVLPEFHKVYNPIPSLDNLRQIPTGSNSLKIQTPNVNLESAKAKGQNILEGDLPISRLLASAVDLVAIGHSQGK